MKTVVIIPIKKKSQRVPGKNFKRIRGKALYEYTLEKVKKCNFDDYTTTEPFMPPEGTCSFFVCCI